MTLVLSNEEMVEDMATRMESFRSGMASLIQSTGIHPDVAMAKNNQVGITLIDDKYGRDDLLETARLLALKRFQDLKDAEPIPEPTPEEQKEIEALMEGEGDPIPAHEDGTAS